MKFSELNTDKALDILCELAPSVANIVEDEKIINGLRALIPEKWDKEDNTDGLSTVTHMAGGLVKLAPILLKLHREDVYSILSVLNEKPISEIANQSLTETRRQVQENLQDSELLDFFKSFVRRGRNAQSAHYAGSPDSEQKHT